MKIDTNQFLCIWVILFLIWVTLQFILYKL